MAKQRYDDDLFKDSTMTFGEHLEELRVCLFRALAGLAIGVVIGLAMGKWVVNFFEAPMRAALIRNIQQINFDKLAADRAAKGLPPPAEDDPELKRIEHGWEYEDVQISGPALVHSLAAKFPQTIRPGPELQGPPTTGDKPADQVVPNEEDLIPVRIWTKIADNTQANMVTMTAPESFMIWMKASFVAGIVLSAPWVFYQIWVFVAAGLYPHEKHYVHVFLPFSVALFMLGASMAYFFVFQPVLDFLFAFNRWFGWSTTMRIGEWLSFVLLMPLGFGVSFQLPLVMLFIERIGIVSIDMYVSKWRIAVLAIAVLAMLLTPSGDPQSMLLMAAPLIVLYGCGILLCKYMPRGADSREEVTESTV